MQLPGGLECDEFGVALSYALLLGESSATPTPAAKVSSRKAPTPTPKAATRPAATPEAAPPVVTRSPAPAKAVAGPPPTTVSAPGNVPVAEVTPIVEAPKSAETPAPAPARKESEPKADEDAEDEVDDWFAEDDEGEEKEPSVNEALEKAKAAAMEKLAKKEAKQRSLCALEIKPWSQEQDLMALFNKVKATVVKDGLVWSQNCELKPVAFGLKKIALTAVINQTISMDEIIEEITEDIFPDEVQSMELLSMSLLAPVVKTFAHTPYSSCATGTYIARRTRRPGASRIACQSNMQSSLWNDPMRRVQQCNASQLHERHLNMGEMKTGASDAVMKEMYAAVRAFDPSVSAKLATSSTAGA